MLTINKISSASAIDYAAEELRKYLRMMMPHSGRVIINYAPEAKSGFRLGLMQDFGLDVSDAEDTELDDIIYIDTDREGGIIVEITRGACFLRFMSSSVRTAAVGLCRVRTENIFR